VLLEQSDRAHRRVKWPGIWRTRSCVSATAPSRLSDASGHRWRTAWRAWQRSSWATPKARWRQEHPRAVRTRSAHRGRAFVGSRRRSGSGRDRPSGTRELVDDALPSSVLSSSGAGSGCATARQCTHARDRPWSSPRRPGGHSIEGHSPTNAVFNRCVWSSCRTGHRIPVWHRPPPSGPRLPQRGRPAHVHLRRDRAITARRVKRQHCLYFRELPHGHGSLRPVTCHRTRSSCSAASSSAVISKIGLPWRARLAMRARYGRMWL